MTEDIIYLVDEDGFPIAFTGERVLRNGTIYKVRFSTGWTIEAIEGHMRKTVEELNRQQKEEEEARGTS